jgi:uncharacterized protein YerC
MFYKVNNVTPLENYILLVKFENDLEKYYDIKPLFKKWTIFNKLKQDNLYQSVKVDAGGYGISWNEEIDLSSDELWENGTEK